MKKTEHLDSATSPDGTVLTLYRHDGEYYIRADGIELMSTRRFRSEERLAEIVCGQVRERPGARVLIGGLGLGFTLRASLRSLMPDASVTVVELLRAVIDWNLNPAYELAGEAVGDRRVSLVHDDVAHVLSSNRSQFDGIMMDVDNGTDALTSATNRRLYRDAGIRTAISALRPGGTIAYWSATADDALASAMRRAGLAVTVTSERAYGTGGPRHFIYSGCLEDAQS